MLRYLRQREIVHYQRFAEGLELVKDKLNEQNYYAFNISLPFDNNCTCGKTTCS